MYKKNLIFCSLVLLCFCSFHASLVVGEDQPLPNHEKPKLTDAKKQWNQTMKTLGGRQVWGDLHFFRGWKIQQNVLTKHYRLLDVKDIRHAWGTQKNCEQKLNEIKQKQKLLPMNGKAVILIHGIIRSSKSFTQLKKELSEEGYTVCGFEYPSTRISIQDSAEYLHQTLQSLQGIDEIYFVVHSMGGLVVRAFLKKHEDKRIKRMVMMGVPNKGANMANRLANNALYKMLYGPAGQQLVSNKKDGFIKSLPTPQFEFGIIAGGRGNMQGYNPLIPGDDDGTVSVSSTRLPGATDFVLVNSIHSFLMFNEDVSRKTRRFLKKGEFRRVGKPHPIPKETEKVKS